MTPRPTRAGIAHRLHSAGRLLDSVGNRLAPPTTTEKAPGADFDAWVDRRSLKLKADFPPRWRALTQTGPDVPRVAVLIHVYYPELLDELLDRLAHLPVEFDVIITNASGVALDPHPELPLLRTLHVLEVPNRGRDILPTVSVVNAGLLDPYELVLKLHTKRSDWRAGHADFGGQDGEEWRQGFLDELIGSRAQVERILSAFALDGRLGTLTSSGNVLGPEFWGGDEKITGELLRRLQLELDPGSLRFASGSIYWIRGFLLQGLRALDLSEQDFEPEAGQVDGTTAHGIERLLGIVAAEAGYDVRDGLEDELDELAERAADAGGDGPWSRYGLAQEPARRARVIPFYLPQFHTFPENEQWWGHGFTEWSNVAAAQPVFRGHAVPLLPADLGFYDLGHPAVRDEQYELATAAGVEGFMYYYYWFAGKTLMSGPVEDLVASDRAHPFCIMWANENWTRTWDGSNRDVLIAQDYERVPATRFIHDVLHLLKDERYIRVDGKPLLAVYRLGQIPDYLDVIDYWRRVAVDEGLGGLELVTVDVGASMEGVEGHPSEHGADSFLEFAPHNKKWWPQDRLRLGVDPRFQGNIMNYGEMARHHELELRDPVEPHRYPGVMVNFDNTARRQWRPDVWYGSNPYTFRRWLSSAISAIAERDRDDRIVFVNAWNEWAESAVLEPTQRFGHTYLLAARDAVLR